MTTTETPLGLKNNNPGNIRVNPHIRWQGEIPSNGPYCIYGTPLAGLRALAKTLWTYQNVHGCRTVADFVRRWSPPSENDTQAYIDSVILRFHLCSHLPSINKDTPIDISERRNVTAMMLAIIWQENGCQPYTATQINDAIDAAGEWSTVPPILIGLH